MDIKETGFKGLYLLKLNWSQDNRGTFTKPFNYNEFIKNNLIAKFKENYYTVSRKNVIRGMHFQIPPFECTKLVYVSFGEILDVVLDLRKDSKTFGQVFDYILSDNNKMAMYIPPGFAHGFKVIWEHTIVNYLQTSVYSVEHDKGIHWSSFNYEWNIKNPIVSERDQMFPKFKDYIIKENYF